MAKKGAPAQEIYPVIVLNPGVPRMGSPEFIQMLKEWHAKHNGPDQPVPFRLTEQGKRACEQ